MHAASNTLIVILGMVIAVALVITLERHKRRLRTRSSTLGRRTRVAANDALRSRLASKVVRQVGKQKQELERMQE
jgi:hypothetical protein